LDENDEEEVIVAELQPHENNQTLYDDPNVQALNTKEIEELKKQGLSGQEIIEIVKQSHSSFDKKTTFSREKYIKRKQQKFLQRFTPEPITSSELIDIYLAKDGSKIQNMSIETLGLIMSMADIQPGGTYLVVDDVSGVLVGALMERMGGEGLIVCLHEHEHPNLDALRYMNYSEKLINTMVKSINWMEFLYPEDVERFAEIDADELKEMKSSQRGSYYRKRQRYCDYTLIRSVIDKGSFDGLVVATMLHLPDLVPRILHVVGGSRPIVVYSEYKEILVETSHVFQKDLRILAPTIMETRVRKYQTLPGRMHPHMTMVGHGGYVLWGIRVYPSNVNAVGVGRKKRKIEQKNDD
jgi:tRNA (adenine-N(1)-)-methyltransferase non-catalytic subunit